MFCRTYTAVLRFKRARGVVARHHPYASVACPGFLAGPQHVARSEVSLEVPWLPRAGGGRSGYDERSQARPCETPDFTIG